jgi:malonyl-CoA O-methyltransferase
MALNNLLTYRTPTEFAQLAILDQLVGDDALQRFEWITLQPEVVLDLGCTVGRRIIPLQQRFANAKLIAIDETAAMLNYAATDNPNAAEWICATAENIPLPNSSVDIINMNLVLPWSLAPEKLIQECRRVLKPNGLFSFTSLGPGSLLPLAQLDLELPNFLDMHDVGDALTRAGFAAPVLDCDYYDFRYRDFDKLTHELLVAGMIAPDQVDLLKQLPPAPYPLTFEVIFAHAWVPPVVSQKIVNGEVKIPLAAIRRNKDAS